MIGLGLERFRGCSTGLGVWVGMLFFTRTEVSAWDRGSIGS